MNTYMLNILLIKSDFLKNIFINNSLNIINIGPFHKGSILFLKFNSSTHYFFDHHFQKAFFENKLNWPPVNFQVFLILVRIFPPLKITFFSPATYIQWKTSWKSSQLMHVPSTELAVQCPDKWGLRFMEWPSEML